MASQTTDQMEITYAAPGTPYAAGITSVASQESSQVAQTNLSSGQTSHKPQSKYASSDQPGRPSATNTGGTPTDSQ
ncbi:hypothetical protein G6F62_012637 [Rhizopus arrhizus]|nr:hypothetical protein G6F23_012720 [Rhizopus arrhizus]KAG0782381.1 hypothetical protein G6F21_011144 [Rhizopus arrhizus]KAG0960310.1 hypothetical protein G6F31_010781 [Rhizopus arrhizus]KAG1103474.1 hypothetical protein G6F40_011204 [Rhizopus arrhizus]KAG1196945.1 hypothetical protein G6F35_012894 [Rhizopus arrhizus]